jgi:DNA-binding IclR family transcriptional regulator
MSHLTPTESMAKIKLKSKGPRIRELTNETGIRRQTTKEILQTLNNLT